MLEKIKELISELPGMSLDKNNVFDVSSHLANDLMLDSIDLVELSLELERFYKITIRDNEIENWITIQDIINTLNKSIK